MYLMIALVIKTNTLTLHTRMFASTPHPRVSPPVVLKTLKYFHKCPRWVLCQAQSKEKAGPVFTLASQQPGAPLECSVDTGEQSSSRVLRGHRTVQTKHLVSGAALNPDRRKCPEEIKGAFVPSNNGDLLS